MQRMFNLSKWRVVTEGELIRYEREHPRTVKFEVNAPNLVRLDLIEDGREPVFLARVIGRDVIEFSADGSFEVTVSGGECFFYTVEGDDWSVEPVDDRTFTKIVERRTRNPELEHMMYVQQMNMERRLEEQAAELERRFAARFPEGHAQREFTGTTAVGGDAPVNSGAGLDPDGTSGDSTKTHDGAGTPDSGSPAAPATEGTSKDGAGK